MKKVAAVIAIGLLMYIVSIGQISIAQSNPMSDTHDQPAVSIEAEIRMLKLINQAGLTNEQLIDIRSLLSGLREAQQTFAFEQETLRDFLIEWQGDAADFQAALQPFEAQVMAARQGLTMAHETFIMQLKSALSYQQGELFFSSMHQGMTSGSAMGMHNSAQMDQNSETNMHSMMHGQMQEMANNQGMGMSSMPGHEHQGSPESMDEHSHDMGIGQGNMMGSPTHASHGGMSGGHMEMGMNTQSSMGNMHRSMMQMMNTHMQENQMSFLEHLNMFERLIEEKLAP